MKAIRHSVFETNSSSTHSVTIPTTVTRNMFYLPTSLWPDLLDNKVHVSLGEFGWGYDKYTNPFDKLSYLCTMLVETEGRNVPTREELYETEGFRNLNETISQYCNCKGIEIISKLETRKWREDGQLYLSHYGYIDHQSCESYRTLQDFLDHYRVSIKDFVFNSGIALIIDNDNH